MARVRWSSQVRRALASLPRRTLIELLRAVEKLEAFPEVGRLVEAGRYRGTRRLPLSPHYTLYYRVVGRERQVVLTAIRDARRRPV
jgi:plasmid stabilization system protein ParE